MCGGRNGRVCGVNLEKCEEGVEKCGGGGGVGIVGKCVGK